MDKIKLFLKNGHVVEFYTESFKTKVNGLGGLLGLEWTGVENKTKLLHVDVEDISAITYVTEEEEA